MFRILAAVLTVTALATAATVSGEMNFDRNRLEINERDGMSVVSLERHTSTWEAGAPSLPIAVAQLVVPQGMKVVAVRLDAVETETVPGTFDVYPVQPPRPLSTPGPFAFVAADPKHYGSLYPPEAVTAGHQGSMSGYSIASVFVAPVQYDGTKKSLVFRSRVRFTLELVPTDLGYLRPGNRSPEARRRIEAQIANIVLNPQDIAACAP